MIVGIMLADAQPVLAVDDPLVPPKPVTEVLSAGRVALKEGELEKARRFFEEVIKRDPGNVEAYYRLATVHVLMGQYQKGVEFAEKSVELSPGDPALMVWLGDLYDRLGIWDKAARTYASVLGMVKDPSARSKLTQKLDAARAGEMLAQGRAQEAIILLERKVSEQPREMRFWNLLVDAYVAADQKDRAERVIRQLLDADPDNIALRTRLAQLMRQSEHLDESLREVQGMLSRVKEGESAGREVADLAFALAGRFREQGDLHQALGAMELALQADPYHMGAWTDTGLIYQQMGNLDEAERRLKRALEIEPNNVFVHVNLGNLYAGTRRRDLAKFEFEKVVRLDQNPAATQHARQMLQAIYLEEGDFLSGQGKYDQAAEQYNRVIEMTDNKADVLVKLGILNLRQGRGEAALRYFEQARVIEPKNPRIYYYLGATFDGMGRWNEALAAYAQALAGKSEGEFKAEDISRQIAIITAKRSFETGEYDAAERVFRSVAQETPDNDLVHYYLAMILDRAGNPNAASKEYEEVVRLNPGHMGARINLGRMYEQRWMEEDALAQYNIITRSPITGGAMRDAEQRLAAVGKRINGFNYQLSQALSADDNVNLNDKDPQFDYRSDLSFGLTYQYKMRHNLRFRLLFNPAYSAYVMSGFDVFNITTSPTLTWGTGDTGMEFGYSYADQKSFLNETRLGSSESFYAEFRKRFDGPLWGETTSRAEYVPNWQPRLRLNYRDYESETNDALNAYTYTAQLFLTTRLAANRAYTFGYAYSGTANKNKEGRDYADTTQGVNAGIEQSLGGKWTGNLRLGFAAADHANPDSYVKTAANKEIYRRSLTSFASVNLTYAFHPRVRFFGGYMFTKHSSNLPAGRLLKGVDVIVNQSNSLGDYTSQSFTVGVGLSF